MLGVSTVYVANKTGAPMDVGICTASDDSIQAWVNRQLVTNVSQPRGVVGDCAETFPATLAPGINKITCLVVTSGDRNIVGLIHVHHLLEQGFY